MNMRNYVYVRKKTSLHLLTSEVNVAWSNNANGSSILDPLANADILRGKFLPKSTCANRTVYTGGLGLNIAINLVFDTITLLPAWSGIISDILAMLIFGRAANRWMNRFFSIRLEMELKQWLLDINICTHTHLSTISITNDFFLRFLIACWNKEK